MFEPGDLAKMALQKKVKKMREGGTKGVKGAGLTAIHLQPGSGA